MTLLNLSEPRPASATAGRSSGDSGAAAQARRRPGTARPYHVENSRRIASHRQALNELPIFRQPAAEELTLAQEVVAAAMTTATAQVGAMSVAPPDEAEAGVAALQVERSYMEDRVAAW